jgi:alpha-galactosidase
LAVPIITDIVLDRKSWRPAINTLNDEDYITNLPRSGCIEAPAVVDAGGVHPEHVGELPEGFAAMIRTQQAIQRLLVQAFLEGSKKLLLQALLLDPVVHSAHAAGEVLDTMLDLQKEYVPAFC